MNLIKLSKLYKLKIVRFRVEFVYNDSPYVGINCVNKNSNNSEEFKNLYKQKTRSTNTKPVRRLGVEGRKDTFGLTLFGINYLTESSF